MKLNTNTTDTEKNTMVEIINQKITAAIHYCEQFGTDTETRNDASNIFAASYDEYITIWEALANL